MLDRMICFWNYKPPISHCYRSLIITRIISRKTNDQHQRASSGIHLLHSAVSKISWYSLQLIKWYQDYYLLTNQIIALNIWVNQLNLFLKKFQMKKLKMTILSYHLKCQNVGIQQACRKYKENHLFCSPDISCLALQKNTEIPESSSASHIRYNVGWSLASEGLMFRNANGITGKINKKEYFGKF